jgi:hypothetical protein
MTLKTLDWTGGRPPATKKQGGWQPLLLSESKLCSAEHGNKEAYACTTMACVGLDSEAEVLYRCASY